MKLKQDYILREVWRHNSYLGQTAMARQAMTAIIEAPTVTGDAKLLARCIFYELQELSDLLGTRIDPPSAFKE